MKKYKVVKGEDGKYKLTKGDEKESVKGKANADIDKDALDKRIAQEKCK